MSLIQGNTKVSAGGYAIDQSIRFDGSATMTRQWASNGNRRTFTISTWVKPRGNGTCGIASGDGDWGQLHIDSAGNLLFYDYGTDGSNTGNNWYLKTQRLFRDPSSWYHIVAICDTTQATSSDRIRLYINGVRETDLSVSPSPLYPAQNFECNCWGRTRGRIDPSPFYIGGFGPSANGYLAHCYYLDGVVAEPAEFGEVSANTGQWVPIEYTGSFGTQGHFITGEDSADLGADYSGNANDFTTSSLSSSDQITGDTPTTNACVMSPIDQYGSTLNLADGNLRCTPSTSSYCSAHGTVYVNSGKWVIECKHTTVFGEGIGFAQNGQRISGSSHRGFGMFADGRKFVNTTYTATGTGLASGDYRYCFLDLDNNAMWFAHVDVSSSDALVYDNGATKAEIEAGTTTNAVHTSLPAGDYAPTVWMDTSGVIEMNFGQSAFYTSSDLPEGFKALNTANLGDPIIALPTDHFQTVLDTGANIKTTAEALYTDQFEWIKDRVNANNHQLIDSVRGTSAVLQSNSTGAETTYSAPSGNSVAWVWKANGTGSTNTDGSVTSTVSSNTTAGFSICTTSGSGGAGTFGHGLGVTPSLIIPFRRTSADSRWVFHQVLGPTKGTALNSTSTATTSVNFWNNTSPTSSIVNVGNTHNNSGDTYVFYCFAEVEGFSKFGSFVGNNSSNGPMIYTGFKPAYFLVKNTGAASSWLIFDGTRKTYNLNGTWLQAESTNAEATVAHAVDFLSNGVKVRTNATATLNGDTSTYIFAAFAEAPFKTANAR